MCHLVGEIRTVTKTCLCPCGDSGIIQEWQCKGPGARNNLMHEMCLCEHRWGNGGNGQLIQDLMGCVVM